MSLKIELEDAVDAIADIDIATRHGDKVPTTKSFNLSNEGIRLNAAYMYIDLVDSTKLANTYSDLVVAKMLKAFLTVAAKVVLHFDGEIRSFDGDRIMAVFIGEDKSVRAVRAAWTIHWSVKNIAYEKVWRSEPDVYEHLWMMRAGIGIDCGPALIIRGGVRKHNDLVSVGRAPNVAAKLSEIRDPKRPTLTCISDYVWDELPYSMCFKDGPDDRPGPAIWGGGEWTELGGSWPKVYCSTYWRTLS